MSEENRKELEKVLNENFADDLWQRYLQTMDISQEQYRLLNGYRELEQFIHKATGGKYSYRDIVIDENGKIAGLPDKMCQQINSQEANARYEELRDDIYMLKDYENKYGLQEIRDFNVKYQIINCQLKKIS